MLLSVHSEFVPRQYIFSVPGLLETKIAFLLWSVNCGIGDDRHTRYRVKLPAPRLAKTAAQHVPTEGQETTHHSKSVYMRSA